jgi:GT2 family glycosyltransferase
MSKFAFVILHYNTIEDTHKCVDSIRRFVHGADYYIIIVDNCSPNQSGPILKDEYENADNIVVLLNDDNLGFAKGNNVGFVYAKYELKANFIILLNSDTELLDENFVLIVEKEYDRSRFALLGPMVRISYAPYVLEKGRNTLITTFECIKSVIILLWYCFLNFFGLDEWFRFLFRNNNKRTLSSSVYERTEDIQIHGCFMIFSPQYIEVFDGLNPRTFLYREEELLFVRLKQNGLKSVYLPSLQIFHKSQGATNSLFQCARKKRRFAYIQRIKSTIILFRELS